MNTVVLVVSNLADSGVLNSNDIDFTAKVTLLPLQSNITYYSSYRYVERSQYLGAGECAEYQVTFNTTGSKMIQTFGTKDTKMELYSSSGSLLASDDDDGYGSNSFIRYYVTAGNTYKIKVYFYNSSNSGETKLAITPAYLARGEGVETVNTYDDIYEISGYTNYTWSTFAEKHYTQAIIFKAPSDGKYLFEIESDFDTFVYVLDPRSTKPIVNSEDFDDDSGVDSNPSLTKQLSANVQYFVIYSEYNPDHLTSNQNMTLKISRKLL